MQRRQFFNWFGLGILATYLPVALAACSEQNTNNSETPPESKPQEKAEKVQPNAQGFLLLGTTSELKETGYLINKEYKVIALAEKGNISALSLVCTHQSCTVNWQETDNKFVCPCHGSQFAMDGKVLSGFAKSPLPPVEVKEESGNILVKVA